MKWHYDVYQFSHGIQKVKTKTAAVLSATVLAISSGIGASVMIFGSASAITPPAWELNPSPIVFSCGGGTYSHTIITVSQDQGTGDFSGDGAYDANPAYTWDISGNITGDSVTFSLVYTGINSGYTLNGEGVVDPDGSVSGTTDGNCQTFSMPANSLTPYCYTVDTSKGILTAAQVGGDVNGNLSALGCDIGVYYNSDNTGNVNGAAIHSATSYGVFVDGNVSDVLVDVVDSEILNIGDHSGGVFTPTGAQHGVGVYYAGFNSPGRVAGSVRGNNVEQYQKGGIVISGENARVNILENMVIGLSPVPFIAQNGIQVSYGATGQIKGNSVNGNSYQGADWTSTGILVFESSGVIVQGNSVANNQTGIAIETWCYRDVQSATNNKVVNNDVSGAEYGVSVAAYNFWSDCDAIANNNKVTNNNISTIDGDTGVFVGTGDYGAGETSPESDNNKVVSNHIKGFETAVDTGDSTKPKVHANVIE